MDGSDAHSIVEPISNDQEAPVNEVEEKNDPVKELNNLNDELQINPENDLVKEVNNENGELQLNQENDTDGVDNDETSKKPVVDTEKEILLNENYSYKISDGFLQNSDVFIELADIKFDGQIKTGYLCDFCHLVLWKPINLECDHVICESCQSYVENDGFCPIDEKSYHISDLQVNYSLHSEITDAMIHCIEVDCNWIGKLRELEEHFSKCAFRKVECPHCDDIVKVDELHNHVVNLCDYRCLNCQHCAQSIMFKDLGDHENTCNDKPVSCPNQCKAAVKSEEITIIKQGDLESHLTNECPERKTPCQFADFQCSKVLKFRKLNIHLVKNSLTHLDNLCDGSKVARDLLEAQILTMVKLKEKIKENDIKINNLQLKCGPQLLWKINNVKDKYQEAMKSKSNELLSGSFYSSAPYGYKLTMRVMLNGNSAVSTGRYISVFISICDNVYNNLLTWPFQQKVTVHLVNQSGGNHLSYSIIPNPIKENLDYLNKPTTERNPFFGIEKFCPCSFIDGNTEYCVDDIIYMRVNVEPYSVV